MDMLPQDVKQMVVGHLDPRSMVWVGGVSRQFRDMSSVEQANVVPTLAKAQRRYRAHLKQLLELIEAVKDLAHSRLQWADHPSRQMSPAYDAYQADMRDRIHHYPHTLRDRLGGAVDRSGL
jgi:hypothetical protein